MGSYGLASFSVKGELWRDQLNKVGQPIEPRQPVAGTGLEQVSLERHPSLDGKSGQVIATNSLGQKTFFKYQTIDGTARLLEVRGAPCAGCAGPNLRFAYDRFGHVTELTRITPEGVALETERREFDIGGRIRKVSRVAYLNGTPQPAVEMVRYEYDASAHDQPVRIIRPSVIAGQAHITQIQYNAHRQPLKVTESGFSPLDAKGEPTPNGSPIERTTSYTYAMLGQRPDKQVNDWNLLPGHAGHSVLVAIDGPWPNGPKNSPEDSDITTLEWDATGTRISKITRPMGLTTAFSYDATTLPVMAAVGALPSSRVEPSDANPSWRMVQSVDAEGAATRYRYNLRGQVLQTERLGHTVAYRFDQLGHLRHIEDAPGRAISLDYNVAGQLQSVTDAQGFKAELVLDTEGNILRSGLFEPNQAQPLRATYRWFDAQRRITKQLRADGRIDTYRYGPDGQSVLHTDGDDVLHWAMRQANGAQAEIDLTSDGLIRAQWQGAQAAQPIADPAVATEAGQTTAALDPTIPATNVTHPTSRRDDFGRTVVAWLPGQGARIWTHDAVGHVLTEKRLDTRGQLASVVTHTYDATGRLTQRQTTNASGQPVQTVTRRYDGARLVAEADDAQVTEFNNQPYSADAANQTAQTQLTLNNAQGQPVFNTTLQAVRDASTGEVSSRTLADGQVMRISRDASTQVAKSISLQSPFWAGLHDLVGKALPIQAAQTVQAWMPQTVVLSRIAFHPFNGITGYAQGNGVVTTKGFDIAGRLTALTVSAGQQPQVMNRSLGYAVGPRIQSIDDALANFKARYDYNGFGMLKAAGAAQAKVLKTGLGAGSKAAIERDLLGRTRSDGINRYTYTADGQVQSVSRLDDKPIATYRYNAQSQRVSKTLASGQTTYYLWQSGKLVAEISAKGEVTAQYLYLSDEGKAAPIAKLETAEAEGNRTGEARLLYIHSDHRGEPVAMTDAMQTVVWKAQPNDWGYINAQATKPQGATLNLRLPGQYFDAESGLHDNWHRTYDPRPGSATQGRYLSPDPLGYPDGPDNYAYAGGDPINKVDPMGLYEEDIHYYMTFFLSLAAGLDYDTARTVALAAQYVDDNPQTKPVENLPLTKVVNPAVVFWNQEQLLRYHFVLSNHDTGKVSAAYQNADLNSAVSNPSNQLSLLQSASEQAPNPCARDQLFGEYLHAFEDTFSHRKRDNTPYNATNWLGAGTGHGLEDGSEPD